MYTENDYLLCYFGCLRETTARISFFFFLYQIVTFSQAFGDSRRIIIHFDHAHFLINSYPIAVTTVTMSEDCDPTFAPLTERNYAEWEIHMEADLVDKGLIYLQN